MSITVVVLPEESAAVAPEYPFVLSADGMQVDSSGSAVASLLPLQARAGAVLVLPARSVSWLQLALPARVVAGMTGYKADPARVRSVLAGALEDQLLDEPARLHFAVFADGQVNPEDASRNVRVAVCNREWLQKGLQGLETAGIQVTAIVAEAEPVESGAPPQMFWSGSAEQPWVAISDAAGVVNLPSGNALAAMTRDWPPEGRVISEPGVMARAESLMGNRVQVQTQALRWLAVAGSRRNLAQLEFSQARGNRWNKVIADAWQAFYRQPQWRPVRWGLLLLCAVQIAGLNVLAWQEKKHWAGQRASLRNTLVQTFPQVTVVIDPALQMQREVDVLAQSRGLASGLELEPVLAQLVQLTASEWTAIDMEDGQLRIQGGNLPASDLATLNPVLAQRGLAAEMQGNGLLVRSQERK